MALYTFYFWRSGGVTTSFDMHDLENDRAAADLAEQMLIDHLSCSHVEVCQDHREVVTRWRTNGFEAPMGARRTASESRPSARSMD